MIHRPTKLTRRALLASTILAVPLAAMAQAPASALYRDPKAPIEARVRDLISRMTLEEKAAQMGSIWLGKGAILGDDGAFSPAKAAGRLANGVGQVGRPGDTQGSPQSKTASFRGPEDVAALVNGIQRFLTESTRLGIPALFHEETAHGLATIGATSFPIPPALGSTWDPGLVERAFAVAGREARLRGATIALSPVLDLARDPRFGRMEEFFGEDPYHVGQMGIAAVRGQQGRVRPLAKDKVFVTLKHFIHGTPNGGLNASPADMSERTLRELYLRPFETVIRETDPAIVMPSYNELQGLPAHANADLLIRTGRERLGFKGPYFSDYFALSRLVSDHHVAANDEAAAIMALKAGVDAELPDGKVYATLPALVRAGRVQETAIDAAVARILRLKFEAGLFENPYIDPRRAVRDVNTQADIQLARTVAQKAMVLLKNDGVLPLDPRATLKLAVIGPNAEEPLLGGYSGVNTKAVGVLAGIKAAAGPNIVVEHAQGVRITDVAPGELHRNMAPIKLTDPASNKARIAEAVRVAERSDVILLVVGDSLEVTRESIRVDAPGDRNTLGLFGDQEALVEAMIATGKPIVALLLNGRPLAVDRLAQKANALIEGWYLGQEGGNAFADVLFGKVNPGGKLAVAFPGPAGAATTPYDAHPTARLYGYIEGGREPLFPFGFGLSYTTFDISSPRLAKASIRRGETAVVEVNVTNTGARAGDEVVQLYVHDQVSSAPRPTLELRGFKRITLDPGQTRTISFELTPDALAFWDIDMNWTVETGDFTVSIGSSSTKLKSVVLAVAP